MAFDNEAYRTNEFEVTVENVVAPNPFTKISGLSEGEVDSVDQHDPTTNVSHKVSVDRIKFGDVTLERFVTPKEDAPMTAWIAAMLGEAGTGSRDNRKTIGIAALKRGDAQNPVMKFTLEDAWLKSSKYSDLDAGSTELMKHTIVLAVERITRDK